MIDARGLSCPFPVVMVQKAVQNGNPEELQVLLDAECSVENVTRYAEKHGYAVKAEVQGADTLLTLTKR